MKLLIVDDSAMIRRAISKAYDDGYFTDIQTASDGLLAISIFKNQMPDVVTLDITMPNMDGLAALTKMLEIKPTTTVLVISALADHHTAIESLTRGAHQFICKPFTTEELAEALDTIIKDKRGRQVQQKRGRTTSVVIPQEIQKQLDANPGKFVHVSAENYPSGFVPPPKVR